MVAPVRDDGHTVVINRIICVCKDKKDRSKILILRRSKANKSHVGFWEFPGGTVESDRQAYVGAEASREFREETGYVHDLELLRTMAFGEDNQVLLDHTRVRYLIYYWYVEIKNESLRTSSEHSASGWCTLEQLRKMAKREKLTPRTVSALDFFGPDLEQRLLNLS